MGGSGRAPLWLALASPTLARTMSSRRVAQMLGVVVSLHLGCAPGTVDESAADEAGSDAQDHLDEPISTEWTSGPGFGISFRRAAEGDDIAIVYGGYGASRSASEAWADELYAEDLSARGFARLYAVQGPKHVDYRALEIGNSKIAKRLIGEEGERATRIVVIAHSSGAFVAHELLSQLADGRDVDGATKGKVTYFNLDGAGGPPSAALANLSAAWAVYAQGPTGTRSMNAGTAEANAAKYAAAGKGGLHVLEAQAEACNAGARWCLHMVCTNERPHNKGGLDVARDYTDFEGRPVQTGFLEQLDE